MARKSNKTAHVLNLIAGHEASKDAPAETTDTPAARNKASASAPAPSSPAQNISVIDTTEEDPVADLIQEKLSGEFEERTRLHPESEQQTQPEAKSNLTPESLSEPEPIPAPTQQPVPTPVPIQQSDAKPAPAPVQQPEAKPAPTPTQQPIPEPTPAPEPAPEPEPDFVRINVMERIVEDKIIYFMRQFDVCTCDRCVNDTIALTLSGLLPKYIVTTPAAVDPLLSYYTNKYICDVTVEATKACMIIKDNPRH